MRESIEVRQKNIVEAFAGLSDWEARYRKILDWGKTLKPFAEQYRIDDLKVKGCQSQVWLQASVNSEKQVVFSADSDALLVRGLVAILLHVYSEVSPQEILSSSPDFLKKMDLGTHLSPSRSNGLYSMLKQIHYYAMAFGA